MSTSSLQPVKLLKVPTGSSYPSFSPSGRMLYLPNFNSGGVAGSTLTVINTSTSQTGAKSASTRRHHAFSGHLRATGSQIRYHTTKPVKGLSVSTDGAVRGVAGLGPGVYTIRGTMSDLEGDSGVWSFQLTVTG